MTNTDAKNVNIDESKLNKLEDSATESKKHIDPKSSGAEKLSEEPKNLTIPELHKELKMYELHLLSKKHAEYKKRKDRCGEIIDKKIKVEDIKKDLLNYEEKLSEKMPDEARKLVELKIDDLKADIEMIEKKLTPDMIDKVLQVLIEKSYSIQHFGS